MVPTSMEERCEKLEHCGVPKIIELAFEIGLPVNETIVTRNGKKQLWLWWNTLFENNNNKILILILIVNVNVNISTY